MNIVMITEFFLTDQLDVIHWKPMMTFEDLRFMFYCVLVPSYKNNDLHVVITSDMDELD